VLRRWPDKLVCTPSGDGGDDRLARDMDEPAEPTSAVDNLNETEQAPRKRGRRNAARWAEILNTAGEFFADKGYRDTTIDDIAAKVGLLPGSLYYYIDSKEHLLFEWAAAVHRRSIELTIEPPDVAGADAPTRLASLIERWMETIRGSELLDAYSVLDREARWLRPELVERLRAQRHPFRTFVYDILDQGVREEAFDPSMNVSVVTNTIIRLLSSTLQWFDRSGGQDFDAITRWYKVFITRGLQVER
jgi:AcrR family transcriptional regulator